MFQINKIASSLFFCFFMAICFGQEFSAPEADAVLESDVNAGHALFVFSYQETENRYIEAIPPDVGTWSYTWAIYNAGSNSYDPLPSETSNRISIDGSAGYRVSMTDGGPTQDMYCWVMINEMSISIITRDGEGNLPKSETNCNMIYNITAELDTSAAMNYYNTSNGASVPFYYGNVDFEWSNLTDPIEPFNGLRLRFVTPLHWENSYYRISATDAYNTVAWDSVYFISPRPHADFKLEYVPLSDENYYPDRSEAYYYHYGEERYGDQRSAPAMYKLISTSGNANTYTWDFGDGTGLERTDQDTVTHIYKLPGSYQPQLIAINDFFVNDFCYDTTSFDDEEHTATVEIRKLIHANAFSPPNGDNFRFEDVTITDFDIIIFNRLGQKVHEFSGNIRDWDGWDGSVKDSNRLVSTGVYYYVVRDFSYLKSEDGILEEEADEFAPEVYKGFVHVFVNE